jgi:SAM-dependent methyltransferase
MPSDPPNSSASRAPSHRLYRELRQLTCDQLWQVEVPRFERAGARERVRRVAVIRAVGVVIGSAGTPELVVAAREWVRSLLADPEEKVRRYAMSALPKLGAGAEEERTVLSLADRPVSANEWRQAAKTLGLIGGAASLASVAGREEADLDPIRQRIQARLARKGGASLKLDAPVAGWRGMEVNLHSRVGLEEWVAEEVRTDGILRRCGRVVRLDPGLCTLGMTGPFSLADLCRSRCFEAVAFYLGTISLLSVNDPLAAVADMVASPRVESLLQSATEGALRYRAGWVPESAAVFPIPAFAGEVFRRNSRLLNDPREARWNLVLREGAGRVLVELEPKLVPDPRRPFRRGDVPAASHPPLASALARLAGAGPAATVWDPFCGSALELIECGLLGGVKRLIGSDVSEAALAVARQNLGAAQLGRIETVLLRGDFREMAERDLLPDSLEVVITNPPLGMRVRVNDLRGLLGDLLRVAATVLRPGGRLVFPNPVRGLPVPPGLERDYSRPVDMGGFQCWLQRYRKR